MPAGQQHRALQAARAAAVAPAPAHVAGRTKQVLASAEVALREVLAYTRKPGSVDAKAVAGLDALAGSVNHFLRNKPALRPRFCELMARVEAERDRLRQAA